MVASGLSDRVSVAPERLMAHLGLAFALFGLLLWTAFDAWSGAARQTLPSAWGRRAVLLVGLVYIQILLGALVAGNDAGLIYNDWPLMNGRLIPDDYAAGSVWATNYNDGTLVRIDPKTGNVLKTIPIGAHPRGIAVGQDRVWVTVS